VSEVLNIDDYAGRGTDGAIELATAMIRASSRAQRDRTATYVYDDGVLVAAIGPAEMAERHEHACAVMIAPRQHKETYPALVQAGRTRRRRAWLALFEGVF
jgi:hypothetical protein